MSDIDQVKRCFALWRDCKGDGVKKEANKLHALIKGEGCVIVKIPRGGFNGGPGYKLAKYL